MKFIILLSLLFSQAFAIQLDKKAPNFKLKGHDGNQHSLSDYKGKPVVLEWLNHGCPFVRKHYDSNNMQATQRFAINKKFIWLSVISSAQGRQGYSSPEEAKDQKKENRSIADHILLDVDGKVGKEFSAKATPHMVILDKNHIVKYIGAIDSIASTDSDDIKMATNYVKEMITDITSGKKVKSKSNKAYGCSVKY